MVRDSNTKYKRVRKAYQKEGKRNYDNNTSVFENPSLQGIAYV
jgi:hypothetical protein